uniref:Uncharacterized protein n=1 Tax=Anopheles quadriannulatus TaxID=34691 RepID=A0A182XQU4_ANOQN
MEEDGCHEMFLDFRIPRVVLYRINNTDLKRITYTWLVSCTIWLRCLFCT